MATVIDGQQYALSSHLNHSMNKSLIFVKLTDSALKAIEDYLNLNKGSVSSNLKPSIEFRSNDSQGVISIPIKSSEDEKQRFNFTLSNVDAVEPQGSFECIRQSKNKCMESFGNMHFKMQIHANDDSYQKTKVKMAVVEQESKKNSTKVIKASDPNVGRKVKVKRNQISSNRTAHHQHQHQSQSISQPIPQTSQLMSGYNKPNSPPTLKVNGNNVNNVNGIPINNKISVSNSSLNHNNNNLTESAKKILRENIIHLLAIKPFKKTELLSRLSSDGFRDIDSKELSSILTSISLLKDNAYILSKTGWSEVQNDWTHYSLDEKELVKRRNPLIPIQPTITQTHTQNGISPLSDCGSMPAFPSPMSMDCSSPPKSPAISKRSAESCSIVAKRHKNLLQQSYNSNAIKSPSTKLQTNGYHDVLNGWANKPSSPEREPINRVSTLMANSTELKFVDSSLNNASHPSSDSNGICLTHEPFQSLQSNNRVVNFINNENNYVKKNRDSFNRYNTNGFHNSNANGSGSVNSTPNSSPDSGTGSHDGSTLSSSNSYLCTIDETADYLSKYVKISNNEQRAQYKKDFYIEYEEYRKLHRFIDKVASKFSDLETRLNTKVEGSDEWNQLMDQIVKEYEETKGCQKFLNARKRMFYLHDKLAHIKNLVIEFDRNYHKDKNRISNKLQVKSTQLS